MKAWAQKLDRLFTQFESYFLLVLLTLMITAAFVSMVLRWMGSGLAWIDPILRYGVLWIALVGALAAAGSRQHIQLGALTQILPPKWRSLSDRIVSLSTSVIVFVIAKACFDFVLAEKAAGTRAFGQTPLWMLEIILPIGFFLLGLRYFLRIFLEVPTQGEQP